MDKKEKYIKFIVNSLMKAINIEGDRISFPWMMEDMHNYYNDAHKEFPFYKHTVMEMKPYTLISDKYPNDNQFFDNYVIGMYGTKDDEVNEIWGLVKVNLWGLAPELRLDPNDM
jgi:hypothetical protein